jgi:hypothetical protein
VAATLNHTVTVQVMDMWPILETVLDCGTDCGGRGLAPPPKFMIPPPPRPPFMQPLKHCREEATSDGGDMCDAISVSYFFGFRNQKC